MKDLTCLKILTLGGVLASGVFTAAAEESFVENPSLDGPSRTVFLPRQLNDPTRKDPRTTGDRVNEHFTVLYNDLTRTYLAFWTQETFESSDDMHVSFSKSRDGGRTWTRPRVLWGSPHRQSGRCNAMWQLPMLSRSGKLYCLWNQREKPGPGMGVGETFCSRSDDDGESWSEPVRLAPARAWCAWQRPLRLAEQDKYLTAVSVNGRSRFIRFENIDDDPLPQDVRMTEFPRDGSSLSGEEASIVKLPDGRLFSVMRTGTGHPVWSQSRDGGETWSATREVVDAHGRKIAHPRDPCPIYDFAGDSSAGSGSYFVLFTDVYDADAAKQSPWGGRGPLFVYRGTFDAEHEQPVRFVKGECLLSRSGDTHYGNSCYSSYTSVSGENILWYPDSKFYLLGKDVPRERPPSRKEFLAQADPGFSIKFILDLSHPVADERLYEIPGLLEVRIRMAGEDPVLARYDARYGNYLNFRDAHGRSPILEVSLPHEPHARGSGFDDMPSGFRVGIPLSLLTAAEKKHMATLTCAQTGCRLVVDDMYEDVDFLCEPLRVGEKLEGKSLSRRVCSAEVVRPGLAAKPLPDSQILHEPVQYWSGGEFNTWVGDVVVANWKDRFHVFYLLDRRHHRGKGGAGGHYFEHISSSDLRTWERHPTAVPLTNWWFTCGTGTPFVQNGKFCLAYGLHTTRFARDVDTVGPRMERDFRQNKETSLYDISDLEDLPIGSSWVESSDGIHFTPSGKLFHPTQNPAIYSRPDGRLGLVAGYGKDGGRWVSDSLSGWRVFDNQMPTHGDCPCPFEWNGRYYILQGFNQYATSKDDSPGSYVLGRASDVYDGINVPMVAPWGNGRRLMVGWMRHPYGWGGWMLFRELVQRPDGSLGTKWVPEIPLPAEPLVFRATPDRNFVKRFRRVDEPEGVLELSVSPSKGSACWATVLKNGSYEKFGCGERSDTFFVTGIRDLDVPYVVKIVQWYDAKAGITVFDAELAGNRTIVTRRFGRYVLVN